MKQDSTIVMGIDPGSVCLGWGVVSEQSGILQLVGYGVVRPKRKDFTERLGLIFHELDAILVKYQPHEVAVEDVFAYKNVLSALKLGQARGAAIAACASRKLPVASYAPTVIKKSVVGTGHAEKAQVSYMVGKILGREPDWPHDAGDALACAICHINTRRLQRLVQKTG